MKSYTDIEQSKKLVEILPLSSADMFWLNRHIDLTETKYEIFVIEKSNKHIDFSNSYAVAIDNNEIIPCWSLAALLDVLPKNYGRYTKSLYWFDDAWHCEYVDQDGEGHGGETADDPIDACYKMILKLNKVNLL